jgi:hypothetical protein
MLRIILLPLNTKLNVIENPYCEPPSEIDCKADLKRFHLIHEYPGDTYLQLHLS